MRAAAVSALLAAGWLTLSCVKSPMAPDVAFREIGNGTFSPYSTAQVVVVRDSATWDATIPRLGFSVPAQSIDFGRDMAVLVAVGARATSGYSARVTGVTQRGAGYDVHASEETPGSSCVTLPVVSQPFVVIALARSDAAINVAWTKVVRNC